MAFWALPARHAFASCPATQPCPAVDKHKGDLAVPDMHTTIHPAVLPMLLSGPPPPMPLEEELPEFDHAIQECSERPVVGQLPAAAPLASLHWIAGAADAPFLMAGLGHGALTQWLRLAHIAMGGSGVAAPHPDDRRFAHPSWQQRPFSLFAQAVLLGEEWCAAAMHSPGGTLFAPATSEAHAAGTFSGTRPQDR